MDVDESIDDGWDDIIDVLATDDSLGILSSIEQQPPVLNPSELATLSNPSHNSSQPSSKKRKANSDADDIARATEDALMQLGLDPNSDEFKLKKRQIRNRISAQSHRDRKNHHIVELEQEIAFKSKRIEALENEVNLLKQENERLRCLAQRMGVSRTSSELSTRTDLESRLSGNLPYVSAGDQTVSSIGSHTPDYSVSSSTSTSSYILANPTHNETVAVVNNLSLSSSNPILKSLSFICVLCVLCLCSNMSPATPVFNSGASSFLVDTSSFNSVSTQEESSGVDGLHRRLLVTAQEMEASPAVLQSALELLLATTNNSMSHSHNHNHNISLMNASFPKDNLRRRYLERSHFQSSSSPHNSSNVEHLLRSLHDSLSSSPWTSLPLKSSSPLLLPSSDDASRQMRVLRKDLLPYPITQSPQEDWFTYQGRIQAMSSSQIFLRHGMVLLDPAFRPSDQLAALLSQELPSSSMRMKRPASSASLATATLPSTRANERDGENLFLPMQASVMNPKDDLVSQESPLQVASVVTALLPPPPASNQPVTVPSDKGAIDLMLPRLAATTLQDSQQATERRVVKLPSSPHPRDSEAAGSTSTSSASSTTATTASAAAQLIAESNMVTVTIPVSSIKLGRSLQESEDGTIDSVLRLFNLSNMTSANGGNINNSSGSNGDVRGIGYQNAWVEMNCIVVGTKVMWQSGAIDAAAEQTTTSATH